MRASLLSMIRGLARGRGGAAPKDSGGTDGRAEWRISFPSPLYDRLAGFLTGTDLENGCYMTADLYSSRAVSDMSVRTLILPEPGSWNEQTRGSLDPSSAYLNRAVTAAEDAGACLVFVHTHPSSDMPPEFSGMDRDTNAVFFRDVSALLGGRPLGSMVMSRAGMNAVVSHGGRDHRVSRIGVVGRTLEQAGGEQGRAAPGGRYERQEAMLGPAVQGRIRRLDACVVGAGGVGSAVAVQLARLGAGRIRLMDPDVLEESNVHRLHGSSMRQVGEPKVEVVKRHLESFSEARVDAVRGDVCDERHKEAALDADVLVCCTDSMKSRDRLNEMALERYRPLIDVGCNVVAGRRFESTIYSQLVTPATACLWCTGQIDGLRLADEFLTEDQKKEKKRQGYYEPGQPSTVTLTTWAACLAADKLLGLLGLYGGRETASYVDVTGEFCMHRTPPIKKGCLCEKFRF